MQQQRGYPGDRMVGILWVLELLERTGKKSKKRSPWVSHAPTFSALPCKVPRAASIPHLVMAMVTEDMYSRNGSWFTKSVALLPLVREQ